MNFRLALMLSCDFIFRRLFEISKRQGYRREGYYEYVRRSSYHVRFRTSFSFSLSLDIAMHATTGCSTTRERRGTQWFFGGATLPLHTLLDFQLNHHSTMEEQVDRLVQKTWREHSSVLYPPVPLTEPTCRKLPPDSSIQTPSHRHLRYPRLR